MFDQTQNVMQPMGGYQYQGMSAPVQKFNNPLTPEQIKQLQQKSNEFSLVITEEQALRAQCNHRNAEGTADTLTFDPITGEATCTICGYKFKPIDATVSLDEIKDDVERIIDYLQTIKLMYIDLPAEAARDFMPIIAMLEKIPQLFDYASKNMSKHEMNGWQYNNRNMGAINMFNNLQNIFGAGMQGFNPAAQQPQYGAMPMGQPYGAPIGQPYPQAPMSNGFGYPGASYQPQTAGYQFVPQAQPTSTVVPTVAAAPEAPVADAKDATVTTTVTV